LLTTVYNTGLSPNNYPILPDDLKRFHSKLLLSVL
jgi:hypothetical protein